jgi:hypothetical protein
MNDFDLAFHIKSILPMIDLETLDKIITGLISIGVTDELDLADIKEDEIDASLPKIKRRRLVNEWKGN